MLLNGHTRPSHGVVEIVRVEFNADEAHAQRHDRYLIPRL